MLGRLRSHVTRGLGESGGSEDSCRGLQKVEVSAERIGTSTEVNAEDYGLEDRSVPWRQGWLVGNCVGGDVVMVKEICGVLLPIML
jgi:hypothetical protein